MPDGTRILASIMFADIVGYTAMMQKNEKNAKIQRDKFREILENRSLEFRGTIIQYYGDGCLCIFGSAVESVKSAIAIQNDLLANQNIPVRIGLHIGDVVYDDEGVFGDGVNLASRIESMSVPGAILLSDKINDELASHPEISTVNLGSYSLKNVNRTVSIYAVNSENLQIPSPFDLKAKSIRKHQSIAVLPFVNMSTDPENEYFSDGITEEILNALVKINDLQVTARTSSFMFKGKNLDVREIGKQLGVENVLEGSVRKFGNKVRVTAQLISAADGYHKWSESYSRNLEDIFEIQDEISGKIANTLREKLTVKEKKDHLIVPPTQNIDAYNYYLKGLHHLWKWNPEGNKLAVEYFSKAVELEPNFVLPYSSLSFGYAMLGATGQITSKYAFEQAELNVKKALELDDSIADAHLAKTMVAIFKDWDLETAKYHIEKAVELNPGSGGVRHVYYLYYICTEDIDNAKKQIELAQKLDPFSLPINSALGELYVYNREFDKALEQLDRTIELDPSFRAAVHTKGFAYLWMGDYEKSIESFEKYRRMVADPLKGVTGIGAAYAFMGNREKALECIDILDKRKERDKDVSLNGDYLLVYNALGDFDKAFEHLEDGIINEESIFFVRINPVFEKLREDERYQKMLDKYFK